MGYKIVVVIIALFGMSASWAQSASVSLSEDSAQFNYSLLVGGQSFGRTEFGAGVLFNSDDVYLAEVSLQVNDEAGNKAPGLMVGIGGKLYGVTIPDRGIMAVAIGMMLRYSLPSFERLSIQAEGYYAPSIVSFLDAESFWELGLRLEYAVLPQAAAYFELRQFTVKLTDADDSVHLDRGGRIGIRMSF